MYPKLKPDIFKKIGIYSLYSKSKILKIGSRFLNIESRKLTEYNRIIKELVPRNRIVFLVDL
jgi:hypothetical protein